MASELSIGDVARQSGVKVPTIRYYETIGLMRAPDRSDGNRRLYDDGDVRRLSFIRHGRELGFEIDAIRTLLALQDMPHQRCDRADAIAREHLAEVERRIESLMALKTELEEMVGGCAHGCLAECRVLGVLADHGKCVHEHH